MKTLILGGTGMLGHKIFQRLKRSIPDTWCTVREPLDAAVALAPGLLDGGNVIGKVDVTDLSSLERLLNERQPQVIVNCVGVIKQRAEARSAIPSITINALLPHRLAELCGRWGGRLIHFSTDCVFSGSRGNYTEKDFADADDLYGRTKFLGEVSASNALTLRTSYRRALYSGVTTNYLAEVVVRVIEERASLSGLYQVTAPTISKFELLGLLRDAFGLDVEIVPDDSFICIRSMKGEKFLLATGNRCPPWPTLVAEVRNDTTPYDEWRQHAEQTI